MAWRARPIGEACLLSCLVSTLSSKAMKCNHLDVIYERVNEVEGLTIDNNLNKVYSNGLG